MKAKTESHPFHAVFEARRSYENARRSLNRVLAAWLAGDLAHADVKPRMTALQRAQKGLETAIDEHRSVIAGRSETAISQLDGNPDVLSLFRLRTTQPDQEAGGAAGGPR